VVGLFVNLYRFHKNYWQINFLMFK
jgi:hypothetical protein